MVESVQLPITGGFYVNRSRPISTQECKNFYVHINQGGGLAKESLTGTPGLNQLSTSGTDQQANRGSHVLNDVAYFVNGDALYRLTRTISGTGAESFAMDGLGTIEGSGRVSMADNGTQLCILVPSGKGYIFTTGPDALVEITDAVFLGQDPQLVVYIDSFFLFTTDTKTFFISASNDGTSYNALDFGTAEADPDDIIAPIVVNNQLYICGRETLEPFRNGAPGTGSGFPFIRVNGGVISIGVFAPFSAINAAGTFFFIGGDTNESPSVYAFTGSDAVAVSHDGIDLLLDQLTDAQLDDVFAWTYSQDGSKFIAWALPTTTIVYDVTSKKWHERKSFAIADDEAEEFRNRVNSAVKAYGRIIVGDSLDGRVGELDLDTFSEYGNNIIRSVATLPFSNIGKPLRVPMLELTTESGVGNAEDEDPKIWMERSLDGITWTDPRTKRLGKVGETNRRQIWYKNGRASRFEVFRFTMSAKVKATIIKLEAKIL